MIFSRANFLPYYIHLMYLLFLFFFFSFALCLQITHDFLLSDCSCKRPAVWCIYRNFITEVIYIRTNRVIYCCSLNLVVYIVYVKAINIYKAILSFNVYIYNFLSLLKFLCFFHFIQWQFSNLSYWYLSDEHSMLLNWLPINSIQDKSRTHRL